MVKLATSTSAHLVGEQIHSAQVVAALEEDLTGRQPIDSQLWGQLATKATTGGPADLSHIFLLDKQSPINGDSSIVTHGYACANHATGTVELTMRPGSFDKLPTLSEAISRLGSSFKIWAKGEKSAAAAIRRKPIRTLLVMSKDLSAADDSPPADQARRDPASRLDRTEQIRTFQLDRDLAPWLALNSQIFVDLPDQANVTETALRYLLGASWFDPQGFLVAESSENSTTRLVGFHWTKVDPGQRMHGRVSGEVYVLGVTRSRAGSGTAGSLLAAGLQRFRQQGIRRAHLYVESTNPRALQFYRNWGFSVIDADQLLELTR